MFEDSLRRTLLAPFLNEFGKRLAQGEPLAADCLASRLGCLAVDLTAGRVKHHRVDLLGHCRGDQPGAQILGYRLWLPLQHVAVSTSSAHVLHKDVTVVELFSGSRRGPEQIFTLN